jgi:hypothetical protein
VFVLLHGFVAQPDSDLRLLDALAARFPELVAVQGDRTAKDVGVVLVQEHDDASCPLRFREECACGVKLRFLIGE